MVHDRRECGRPAGTAAIGLPAGRGGGLAPAPEPAPPPAPVPTPTLTPSLTPDGPSLAYPIIKIRPEYPPWFGPLAALAEEWPAGALLAILGTLGAAFGGGFGLAWLLR